MPLEEYARKRSFHKTPEPPPGTAPSSPQLRFCIQRHDATRLHYDLRLEMDGTLKSWAVPKGPSLAPLSKQLAMHVEDHPISYGEFEGNIPKGNYGAGSVMLWDQGAFELLGDRSGAEQMEKGDLKFRLHGEKLRGDFALVRMKGRGKGNEWLLIKKRDEHAVPDWDVEDHAWSVKTGRTQDEIAQDLPAKKKSKRSPEKAVTLKGAVKAPMPARVSPMLASIAAKPPPGDKWLYEVKWDGVRAICYIQEGKIHAVSRNGNSFDRQFPELSLVPHQLDAKTAIIDGEIAVLDKAGRSSFGLIQPRIHQKDPNSIAHLARNNPVKLFVFDLLYYNGHDLRNVELISRKRLLQSILKDSDRVQYSEHFQAQGEKMLTAAEQLGLEGVIAKRVDSKYEERRSTNWLKIKVTGRSEFIICGYTHGERTTFSSLVLGQYNDGVLEWVGNVGTGFNTRNLAHIHSMLRKLEVPKTPFARKPAMLRGVTWVKPELVCEVKFSEWTRDGRLRAPVFLGLREDKRAEDVKHEQAEPVEPEAEASREGPLIPPKAKDATVRIDGRSLKFTNLDKIYFPKDGVKKRDLINYYAAVSELILPHLRDRPLSLKRYPNGIQDEFFFQKDTPETAPEWLRIEPIHSEHRGAPIRFVVADDRSTLLYLTNLGCIDQNPWMSRIGSLEFPDYVLIDLDPVECSYDKIVESAHVVRELLERLGIEGYPKTTGGDGMHIFIPLEARYSYDQVRSFAEILAQCAVNAEPNLFTTPRSVAKRRKGRVYFDYLQISTGKTISAPYVVRAYDGAPVSTPLRWEEVEHGLRPDQFHIRNVLRRFEEVGDLFAPVLKKRQKLEPALRRMEDLFKTTTPGEAASGRPQRSASRRGRVSRQLPE